MPVSMYAKPHGAFLNGELVHAWVIYPDAWDIVDLNYDYIRPLTEKEIEELKG